MLHFFKSAEQPQPHLIVDSNGKYYGIYPSLSSAREAMEDINHTPNAPADIYIYKAELIDELHREKPIELTDYQSSV